MLEIYYDDIQEGLWFQSLHERLNSSQIHSITEVLGTNPSLDSVLVYDRPDIVLADSGRPILVLERTVEVPSGHNVGQRFARLAAAAQCRVPIVYFGPYAAYKHGGATQGPRYMNLRLFYALDLMVEVEGAAVTTVNWPVDRNYEIIQTPEKDTRVIAYLNVFFQLYDRLGLPDINPGIMASSFQEQQLVERRRFIRTKVRNPEQYDNPPSSVCVGASERLPVDDDAIPISELQHNETVLYKIGMTYIRSDPYTGMAMLYEYLYAGGPTARNRNFILNMPKISQSMWRSAATSPQERKDIRLFKLCADGILFQDGYVSQDSL